MNLLDRMREEVTVPLRIVGLKGKKEVQLIDNACLESLINIVREYDMPDHDIEIQAAYRLGKYEARADERERCIKIIKSAFSADYWEEAEDIIEAIKAEDIGVREQDVSGYREIREIYAGMDGFIPETAAEAYQQRIIKQMYDAAIKAIKAE